VVDATTFRSVVASVVVDSVVCSACEVFVCVEAVREPVVVFLFVIGEVGVVYFGSFFGVNAGGLYRLG